MRGMDSGLCASDMEEKIVLRQVQDKPFGKFRVNQFQGDRGWRIAVLVCGCYTGYSVFQGLIWRELKCFQLRIPPY